MRRVVLLVIVLLFVCNAFALTQDDLLDMYSPDMDWFSAEEAILAELPEGLTDSEADIFKRGYALGHYAALHPEHVEGMYVLNNKTMKFHYSDCLNTLMIDSSNRSHSFDSKEDIIARGYEPCGSCKP